MSIRFWIRESSGLHPISLMLCLPCAAYRADDE